MLKRIAACLFFLGAVGALAAPAEIEANEEDAFETRLRFLNGAGRALVGARVRVDSAAGTPLASAVTDGEGRISMRGLPRGRHRLSVSDGTGLLSTSVLVVSGPSDLTLTINGPDEPAHFTEDVLVSAEAGLAQESARAPQSTNAISKDEIDARAKATLAEIGNGEAGLFWQRTSPTLGAIFIRGLTGAKVNLYVDGVRFSNAAARGGVNTFFNLLDPSLIESAEVTRGPSSAQYGSDAMGGSVQLFTRPPEFSSGGTTVGGRVSASGSTADRSGGGDASVSVSGARLALIASGAGRSVSNLRTGGGIDSHHAVTRFFGIPSSSVQGDRLPDTSFDQYGGSVRAAFAATPSARFFGTFLRGRIDGSKRYDQLLGGDGNLIADVRGLEASLASLRFEHLKPGFLDLLSVSYSYNSQYEERVNQGGNGNPAASINHEPETTSTHALQARALRGFGSHTLSFGGDLSFEKVTGVSFSENPATGATSLRRGRVPDGATYRSGGLYVQDSFDPSAKAHLVGAARFSFARYEARAALAPVVNGRPLWPDDRLNASSFTFRFGGTYELAKGLHAIGHVGRGFRAPHITDLATLGLTGSGFEASYDSVAALGAQIGTTADASAISTGRGVAVLKPETSLTWELGFHLNRGPLETRMAVFWNDLKGNIEKYAAVLPPGATGLSIGSEIITSQPPNGVVFVALASTPVLIRANQENSRIFGVEHEARLRLSSALSLRTSATYLRAELRETGAPPNIEGGTPNPDAWIALRWTSPSKSFYLEPYAHLAAEQKRLSTLDLGDRRTGSPRSRNNITAFFGNGARARGYVGPGEDGRLGTADDTLIATGETLPQIIARVLGPSGASNSLYPTVHGYQVFGVRASLTIAKRHQILVDLENLTDQNYRGPSWGLDASGRNLFARYSVRF